MTKKLILSSFLLFCLALSSCLSSPTQVVLPTINPNDIAAAVVQTIQAQYAEQTTSAPTFTSSPIPTETPTPSLTSTDTPTFTQTTTPLPTIGPVVVLNIPCNQAAFIDDMTIPDGTQISAGNGFTKTWRLQNTGSCTWTPAYMIVFDSGDLLGAPSSFNMPGYVNPGQTVDISVDITAPNDQGTYQGSWKLEDPNGNYFGVGSNGADFDVQIVVGNSQDNFEVRHVYLSVDNSSVTAACPPGYKFTITADIWTNGSGDVVYHWDFSDGKRSDDHTLHFAGDRHKTVSTTYTADSTDTYWAVIHATQPDDNTYDRIEFALTCTPPLPTNTREPTRTPRPTETKKPANLSLPTDTKELTHTPLPTDTKTPTRTPSLTPTK
jgi:hypothetical protein